MHHLRSYQLAVKFYQAVRDKKIKGPLKNQLQRASSSIALNLSEATGRRGKADRTRFFDIAFGSIRECQSIIELEYIYFTDQEKDLLDHLAASVYKLIRNSC